MKIYGMEKLSLVDYDGQCAAVLFTGGCNFRCPFCHNAALVEKQPVPLSDSSVLEYLDRRRKVLDAVVISGGEPTMQPDLPEYISQLRDLFGYKIKLDTNGTNPQMLRRLVEGGLLDYVAMDVKTSFERYGEAIGVDGFDITPVEDSIDLLLGGAVDYEFRTTLVSELITVSDVEKIARRIRGANKYFLQKFVQSDGCITYGMHEMPLVDALAALAAATPFVKCVALRSY